MLRRAASAGATGYGWCRRDAVGACTESLGSDSGDVGGGEDDAEIIDQLLRRPAADSGGGAGDEEARSVEPRKAAEVPPSLEEKGRRRGEGGGGLPLSLPPAMPRASDALVMRAERRGGRLILTQVRAEEPERRGVFRASRDGGRLRLRFADNGEGAFSYNPEDSGGVPQANNQAAAGSGGDNKAGGAVAPQQQSAGCNGGELCLVAAGGAAGRGRVEVGAVVGI